MKTKFLSSTADLSWLKETHLKELSPIYKYALLFGNEDCPEKIEVYKTNDVKETPVTFIYTDMGFIREL